MGQATLSIRIDEDIKKKFDAFCADVGMNATVAVNMFARAVLREKRIPFTIAGNESLSQDIKNSDLPGIANKPFVKEAVDGACWFESLVGIVPPTQLNTNEIIMEGKFNEYENLN